MKLTEIQCKHSELEKQLVDATLNIAPEQPKNESLIQILHQDSDIMSVETVCQQTAGAIATLMEEIPPTPLEKRSTFHWDFVLKINHKIKLMQRK